jgi:hypothetical protein
VDRGTEQAVTGSSALPAFVEPYTITERLVGWGFGDPDGQPTTGGPDQEIRRAWFQAEALGFDYALRDGDGHLDRAIVGFDVVRQPELIFGLAAGWETAGSDAFDSQVSTDFDGYFFGPFAAWKPDPDLVLDLWLGYAQRDVDSSIPGMEASYDVDRFFVSANATGRWVRGETEIRPKLEIFYANDDTASHSYSPTSGSGVPGDLRLDVSGGHDDLLISILSAEARREYLLDSGTRIAPFGRVGLEAMLVRPNDGEILNDDLEFVSTEPVTGDLLGGVIVSFANGGRLDARVGYGGIGQEGLDVFAGEIAYSIPF